MLVQKASAVCIFINIRQHKSRAQLAAVLEQLRQLLAAALMARRGFPVPAEAARSIAETRTAAALLSACQTLQAALDDCWANVGTANICAGLFVRLR